MNAKNHSSLLAAVMTLACCSGWANAAFENPIPAIAFDDQRDVGDTGDPRGTDPDPCVSWRSGTDVLTGNFSPQVFNTCRGGHGGDDIQLGPHAGRELISYKFFTQARRLQPIQTCPTAPPCFPIEPVGSPYSITSELWTVKSGGECLPRAPIPGTRCTVTPGVVQPGGTGADVVLCEPNGGLPTGVFLPDGNDDPILGQCGVDVYLLIVSSNDGAGFSIDRAEQDIGGPAMDDEFGQSVMVFENCAPGTFMPLATYEFGAFSPPLVSDIRGTEFCTVPEGACCLPDGTCSITQQDMCSAASGTYLGDNEIGAIQTCDSPDADGDGSRDECDLCDDDWGKTNSGICGCGIPDIDTDRDGVADCIDICPGFSDTHDSDGDGAPDGCDGCPNDPNKTEPLICGCGNSDVRDSDGDAVLDCVDQCPGVDDAVFAPGCVGAIPTVSQWGLIVLALLLLVAGKVYFSRRSVLV